MTVPNVSPEARRRAWLVVALLVPVALLNYLDRQLLASMKFAVMQDIPGIALEARWGTVLALFKWVYAAVSPLGGVRKCRRRCTTTAGKHRRAQRQPQKYEDGAQDSRSHNSTTPVLSPNE